MSFSLHNSLIMHVHCFHFTDEVSRTQKSYSNPKVNVQLISNRDGVYIKVFLNPKSMPITQPEAYLICIVLLPKLSPFFAFQTASPLAQKRSLVKRHTGMVKGKNVVN